jgi:inward rectifier potassium channel
MFPRMATRQSRAPVSRIQSTSVVVERRGLPTRVGGDVYHGLLTMSWGRFFVGLGLGYLVVNVFFALLYLAGDAPIHNARPGSFEDAFFFSVQTLATIGYGVMSPVGLYGHSVVACEAFIGLFMVSFGTGLMFAKFARPSARVIFSKAGVFTTRDGKPSFLVRLANERGNQVVEASMRMVFARNEFTVEGESVRRFHDMKLVRSSSPLFILTWTAVHVVDEESPLFGQTFESLDASQAEIIVIVTGMDATFAQTIYARHSYVPSALRWGHRLVDIFGIEKDGTRFIDHERFHETEPDVPRVRD